MTDATTQATTRVTARPTPATADPGPFSTADAGSPGPMVVLELVERLCTALAGEAVAFCHWKSNEALARSLSGDNDLDLLVARTDGSRFLGVLFRLGFKAAVLPPDREVPGVSHFYGLDRSTGRLVHVHAHFRLVLGDDMTKNYWLPIETAYLASRADDCLLPVPAPEHELAVLVLRMVLKHSTWDAQLQRRGALSASEAKELEWLLRRTDWAQVDSVISAHLPFLVDAWPGCRRAVQPGCSRAARVRAANRLIRALEACARRARRTDTILRVGRRVTRATGRRVVRRPLRKRLADGGAVVALAGGDGAGKTTAVEGLARWLSGPLTVQRVHLGRPPESLTTMAVRATLGVGRRVGLLSEPAPSTLPPSGDGLRPTTHRLLRHACTARDRRRAYVRARRAAAGGAVVVCDRFPLAQLRSMDGPRMSDLRDHPALGRAARSLIAYEARQYAAFTDPDLLAVLRVDPEVAVRRKTSEGPAYVRRRSTEVWNATWGERVVVLDASRPAADVLAELRSAVWERL